MITVPDALWYADVASGEEADSFLRNRSTGGRSSSLFQQYKNLNSIFSTSCGKLVQKLRGL